jgi:hypothetical protein
MACHYSTLATGVAALAIADHVTLMAKRIIEAAHRGERDVQRLKEFALAGLNPIADTA